MVVERGPTFTEDNVAKDCVKVFIQMSHDVRIMLQKKV